MTDLDARVAALPDFDDPLVQIVYELVADSELAPPEGEHWDGYVARHIVAAIRAKPAQEEITDAESKKWLLRSAKAEALLRRVHRLMPIFEKGMGQLTFTAETGGEIYAEVRAIQLELSGHTEESWAEAAIRASKGEKT